MPFNRALGNPNYHRVSRSSVGAAVPTVPCQIPWPSQLDHTRALSRLLPKTYDRNGCADYIRRSRTTVSEIYLSCSLTRGEASAVTPASRHFSDVRSFWSRNRLRTPVSYCLYLQVVWTLLRLPLPMIHLSASVSNSTSLQVSGGCLYHVQQQKRFRPPLPQPA